MNYLGAETHQPGRLGDASQHLGCAARCQAWECFMGKPLVKRDVWKCRHQVAADQLMLRMFHAVLFMQMAWRDSDSKAHGGQQPSCQTLKRSVCFNRKNKGRVKLNAQSDLGIHKQHMQTHKQRKSRCVFDNEKMIPVIFFQIDMGLCLYCSFWIGVNDE